MVWSMVKYRHTKFEQSGSHWKRQRPLFVACFHWKYGIHFVHQLAVGNTRHKHKYNTQYAISTVEQQKAVNSSDRKENNQFSELQLMSTNVKMIFYSIRNSNRRKFKHIYLLIVEFDMNSSAIPLLHNTLYAFRLALHKHTHTHTAT